MTPADFKTWRERCGLSRRQAALALGLSIPSIYNYELGIRRESGRPVRIPHTVALACNALAHGLAAWDGTQGRTVRRAAAQAFVDAEARRV
ncbi:helix-turn-helix domain-containing protein [Aureimonas altamirensis]|uniref:helix-turn-helix domain-containing protein n=1 Tax=Aureimonas altamirensis TaxID=370622 RepID=UPI00203694FC|nr:helix-turn-helix transcriptional regulator [Aureimonas altamirensis]MCM2503868.1 helix-turn-helix domain-containing protein [Aureimonas altamirensis]